MTDAAATAVYRYAVGDGNASAPTAQLRDARARSYSLRLETHGEARFTLNGDTDVTTGADPIAALITLLRTDLWIYRDDELVWRGRIVTDQDAVSENAYSVPFGAVDYGGLLRRRGIWPGNTLVFVGEDQADIVWTLVDESQALTGGDWGITRGLAPAGTPRDRSYDTFNSLRSRIDELAAVDGGFDWAISPAKALDVWTPRRGGDLDDVVDLGGAIVALTRTGQPDQFANAGGALGAQGTTPATAESATLGTDPRGRWEAVDTSTSIVLQATLDDRAQYLVDRGAQPPTSWSVKLRPGYWRGPTHIGPGDTLNLRAERGRLNVDVRARVYQIDVTPGDEGVENVTMTLVEDGV